MHTFAQSANNAGQKKKKKIGNIVNLTKDYNDI